MSPPQRPGAPYNGTVEHRIEIVTKGVLCLVAVGVILWRHRRSCRLPQKRAGELLGLMAAVSTAAWFNFGLFHGAGFVHYWEQFHYFLGSKYFPELGYDGLYVASLAAQQESSPELPLQPFVRDLRTNAVAPTYAVPEHKAEVRGRFSAARWRQFVDDNQGFVESNSVDYLRQIRTDHGYNPTPTWTFVARIADRFLPASRANLELLGLFDPLLLAVMFVVVFRTYGSRVGCLALVIFGLGYPWRFDWVGGAFLRQDWLAAVVVGVCMLKRERFVLAGALFAYATMVRIFPVVFVFGLVVVAIRGLVRRESLGWLGRFAGGFTLSVGVCLLAGCLAGRGAGAWPEFARNLAKHRGTWLTNNVGSKNLVLYGPETVKRRLVNWTLPEPWSMWQVHMDRLQLERRPAVVAIALLMLALAGAAAWRSPPDEAAALGVVAVFAVVVLTCYYWVMLLVLPLRRGVAASVGVLGLCAGLYGLDLVTPSFEMIYGAMSWGLAVLFAGWAVPDAVAAVRG